MEMVLRDFARALVVLGVELYAHRLVRTGTKCHKVKTYSVELGARFPSLSTWRTSRTPAIREREKKREMFRDVAPHRRNEIDAFLHIINQLPQFPS